MNSLRENKKTLGFIIAVVIASAILTFLMTMNRTYPLVIQREGQSRPFYVEFAGTPAQQEKGLMFRKKLANNHGMLFIFPDEREVTFWMRNTLIPLDMIFIDASHKISFIHHKAQPHDETLISSNGEIIAVLEIPGGQANSQNIAIGDIVKTPLLAGSKK